MKTEVSEIFFSIQGEGTFIGMKAIFVRFCGCNLNCYFCDTKYALNCTTELNDEEIYTEISKFNSNNIVFTGGEPALKDEFLAYFIKKYPNYNYFLETNGTVFPKLSIELFKHIVVSPKMFSLNLEILKKIKEKSKSIEFKFVVSEDFEEEIILANELSLDEITIQPMWFKDNVDSYLKKTKKIIEKSKEFPINIRVIPQFHKILYGEKRGV